MRNKPSGTAARITMGPGRVLMGATGTTPTVDVGFVRGVATLTFERNLVDIRQGSPQNLIKKLSSQEDVMLEFTGIEWNLENLAKVLGDGLTSVSGADEILQVGGRANVSDFALKYVHVGSDGSTIEVDIWKALPEGNVAISLNHDDLHEFPQKFHAEDTALDWAGATLTAGKQLARVVRTAV